MTYSPGPDYRPRPGQQQPVPHFEPPQPPNYSQQFGTPQPPQVAGPQPNYSQQFDPQPPEGPGRQRTALIAAIVGAVIFIVIGAILLFRPAGGSGPVVSSATPAPTTEQSTTSAPSSSPTQQPTTATAAPTVTVTAPPTTVTVPGPRPTNPAPSVPGGGWPPTGMTLCNSYVAVNSVTSCGFADAVLMTFFDEGPGVYSVQSPTTQQWYSMTCAQVGSDLVHCFGGDGAELYGAMD